MSNQEIPSLSIDLTKKFMYIICSHILNSQEPLMLILKITIKISDICNSRISEIKDYHFVF